MISLPVGILLTVYISAVFMSNLLGLKTMPFIFGTHISFAVFTLPLLFITTDIVCKVYGKDLATKFVYFGFGALVLWTVFSLFSSVMPWSEHTYARIGEAYNTIFTLSIRVAIASLVAFFIAQYLDVLIFHKYKTQKKSFFFASTVSNFTSQGLDTFIFMFIAFYGVFETQTIVLMALPWWAFKTSMCVLYMPFSYILLSYLMKRESKNI